MFKRKNLFKTALFDSALRFAGIIAGIFCLLFIFIIFKQSRSDPHFNLGAWIWKAAIVNLSISLIATNLICVLNEKRQIIKWYEQASDDTSFEGFAVSKNAQKVLEDNFHSLNPSRLEAFEKSWCIFPFF